MQSSIMRSKMHGQTGSAQNANIGMMEDLWTQSAVSVRSAEADADSIARHVTDSKMSEDRKRGETIMKRYRIREGSIADLSRYAFAGLMFGLMIGWAIITTY